MQVGKRMGTNHLGMRGLGKSSGSDVMANPQVDPFGLVSTR